MQSLVPTTKPCSGLWAYPISGFAFSLYKAYINPIDYNFALFEINPWWWIGLVEYDTLEW